MHRTTVALAAAALSCLPGCLVTSNRHTSYSGAVVDPGATSRVVLGSTSPDQAAEMLGPPTSRFVNDQGEEVLTWSWTKETQGEGSVFLIFSGGSSVTELQSLHIAFRDGVAERKWRD